MRRAWISRTHTPFNVYDVVDRPYLVVSEQALARLVEVLGA